MIATNGIISARQAGKIRYLDSRPDEQLRGITMESSAISLYFPLLRKVTADASPEPHEYLINLIDSPGHIDFSSEVSTASRLCDGAVVLVDAVEGVCSQTITVLRQTWTEKLKPLLVINKMDRLVTELKMTPGEAYVHLGKLLEQVNAVLGSFFQGERMEEDLHWRERMEERVVVAAAKTSQSLPVDTLSDVEEPKFSEKDDEDLYFAPEKNNVIFSSAMDGWAFTVRQFAALYEKKLGIKRTIMERVLWGNFYLDPKTRKVLGPKHLKGRPLRPMFVQLVLEQIWAVYAATTGGSSGNGDAELLDKITKSLGISLPPTLRRARDPRMLLTAVFGSWLPLPVALLVSVVESLPSPRTAQADRLPGLLGVLPGSEQTDPRLREAMVSMAMAKGDPVVAYVSKMVSVPQSELPEYRHSGSPPGIEINRDVDRRRQLRAARDLAADAHEADIASGLSAISLKHSEATTDEPQPEPEHLIGFARIYSGTISVGDHLYVLPPKFSPTHPHRHPEPRKVVIEGLYMLMGRNLESLASVPAGVVFGIRGLGDSGILKTGTLCSQVEGACNLAAVATTGSLPIVRVALEPENPADLDKMVAGLKLLVRSDPCAEYERFPSGEHVLLTAGELHLERCLTDLRERYARCEIQAGAPIVPYRETIVRADEMRPPANKERGRGAVVGVTTSKQVTIALRVRPLPAKVTRFLLSHSAGARRLYSDLRDDGDGDGGSMAVAGGAAQGLLEAEHLSGEELASTIRSLLEQEKSGEGWKDLATRIVSAGPRRAGPNLLIDATRGGYLQSAHGRRPQGADTDDTLHAGHFADKIIHAFQMATAQGPLCHEPVQGIAVIVEDVVVEPPSAGESSGGERVSRLTGEVIKTTLQSIHKAFLDWSPRIMLAMYSCEVQASSALPPLAQCRACRRHSRANRLLQLRF